MVLLNPQSLSATLNAVNEALFYKRPLSGLQVDEVLRWLAGRQVQAGRWAGLFAPTDADLSQGVELFSGEKLHTRLAARNVLTAEAARALVLLGAALADVHDMLGRTNRWLAGQCFANSCIVGECAHSGIGLMRYVTVRDGHRRDEWLKQHIDLLSQRRDGQGRWKGFPYYYTLLTLAEMDMLSAETELRYALPACERALKRLSGDTTSDQRRQDIIQRALSRYALM